MVVRKKDSSMPQDATVGFDEIIGVETQKALTNQGLRGIILPDRILLIILLQFMQEFQRFDRIWIKQAGAVRSLCPSFVVVLNVIAVLRRVAIDRSSQFSD